MGKTYRTRIPADADYWQLIPWFSEQINQSYCAVASAITVLNAMPIKKPIDPIYAPHAYFTQKNYFTPEASKIISPETVQAQGMTRDEMVKTLTSHGVKSISIAGDEINNETLRTLLKKTLGDDGQFVLVNYLRKALGQDGWGHWSTLAAYDALSDSVLILDVAKYINPPVWVKVDRLHQAIATLDSTSKKARGLVIVSE